MSSSMIKLKKHREVIKEYEICRCLVTNIQSVTGHKTHEIISFFSSLAESCIKSNQFNVERFVDLDFSDEVSVKDYTYYPNTKIYLGVCVARSNIDAFDRNGDYVGQNMLVKYKFYTPTTVKKLTQAQFDDIVIDAMLTDFSMDFDPPEIRKPKTLVQKKQEEKILEDRRKQRDIQLLEKDLKEILKESLKISKEIDKLRQVKPLDKDTQRNIKALTRDLSDKERQANLCIYDLKELGHTVDLLNVHKQKQAEK